MVNIVMVDVALGRHLCPLSLLLSWFVDHSGCELMSVRPIEAKSKHQQEESTTTVSNNNNEHSHIKEFSNGALHYHL